MRSLTTERLDGRSKVAVAARSFKQDVRNDLGGDLSRAQEVLLEAAAQSWVILASIDDWLSRQPTLITRKRAILPVVESRMRIADSLVRQLKELGLERKARPVPTLAAYLASKGETSQKPAAPSSVSVEPVALEPEPKGL